MPDSLAVLMIHGDPDVARAIALRLEAAGYVVLIANDPESGLRIAERRRPDLVLLDLDIAAPDELLLSRLKAAPATRTIPVIAVSQDASMARRACVAGAIGAIGGAVKIGPLLALLRQATPETNCVAENPSAAAGLSVNV